MRGSGENEPKRPLAMTGSKNPWGQGSGQGSDAPAIGSPGEVKDDSGKGDGPGGEVPQGDSGPRNPWLPSGDNEAARRSASIDDIFRPRGSGRLPGLPGGGKRLNWLPWALAGVASVWLLGTSIHFLGQGDEGLVSLFGRYQRTVGPGLALTLPWPAQSITVRNTGKFESMVFPEDKGDGPSENLILTRDRQLIDLGFNLRWRITDLKQFSYGIDQGDAALRRLAEAEMRSGVAEMGFDELWDGTRREELQSRVARRTQAALDAMRAGVRIEGIEIARADRPARLSDAFLKVQTARQQAEKDRAEAAAWVKKAQGAAINEAAAFNAVYAQYKVAPEVTRQRFYFETMEHVLSANDKVVVGGSGVTVSIAPQNAAAPPAPPPAPAAKSEGSK